MHLRDLPDVYKVEGANFREERRDSGLFDRAHSIASEVSMSPRGNRCHRSSCRDARDSMNGSIRDASGILMMTALDCVS